MPSCNASSISLVNIREAEFPVLVRIVNALEEALALFFLRQMEEDLDDPRAVPVEMLLQAGDGAVPLLPDRSSARNSSESPCPRRISGCTRTISTSS